MKAHVQFRMIEMPCCGQMVCWVNPRIPNYCPECGKFIYADLKVHKPEKIVMNKEAWIDYVE